MLGFSCADCHKDEELKSVCHCETDSELPVWEDAANGDTYYTCPFAIVQDEHYDFVNEVDYIESFGNAVSYTECTARFWESYKMLKHYTSVAKSKPKAKSRSQHTQIKEMFKNAN